MNELREPETGVATETQTRKPLFVFFRGFTFADNNRDLTVLRGIPDLFIPASVITPSVAFKDDTTSAATYHAKLAGEIIGRAEGNNIVLFGHSWGGLEMIDVIDMMIQHGDFRSKKIDLIFLGTPGFTEKGVRAYSECARRIWNLLRKASFDEQHVAYPLPEKYYQKIDLVSQTSSKDLPVEYKDRSEDREERRKWFKESLNEKMLSEGVPREDLLKKGEDIDSQIEERLKSGSATDDLERARAKLLGPVINALFQGKQIDDSVHDRVLGQYGETKDKLNTSIKGFASTLLYLGAKGLDFRQGSGKRVRDCIEAARRKGVQININFAVMERDRIIKPTDVDKIRSNLNAAGVDQMASFDLMENLAHASFGYAPKPLTQMMQRRM